MLQKQILEPTAMMDLKIFSVLFGRFMSVGARQN